MVQLWCSHAHCKHFRRWTGVKMGAKSCRTWPDVTTLTQPMVWVWDKIICLFEQFQAEENVGNSIWYYTLHLEKQKEIENWSSKTALRCLVQETFRATMTIRVWDPATLSHCLFFCVWGHWPHLTDGDVSQIEFLCYADLRGRAFGPRMSNTVYFSWICDLMLNSPPSFSLLLRVI